jgi:8-oxo-dGTP pyrophosphatase MutT (NUDIX family)
MAQDIDVTVAAVIEREGRFLLVEERVAGELVLNQPAGHLEHGESLVGAVARETLEETGHLFTPTHVVGFYLWRRETTGTTYFRVAFHGTVEKAPGAVRLDDGIVGVHWLSRSEIVKRRAQLRSPMVLRCLDDYLAGRQYSLDCLTYLAPEALARTHAARA